MGLFSSDGNECYVCGKDVDPENSLEEDGKQFCCENCKEHYEDEKEEDEKEEVCQFC